MNKKYLIACLLDARTAYEKSRAEAQEYPGEMRDRLNEYFDDHIEAVDNAVFILNHIAWISAAAAVSLVCTVVNMMFILNFIR